MQATMQDVAQMLMHEVPSLAGVVQHRGMMPCLIFSPSLVSQPASSHPCNLPINCCVTAY